MTSVLSTSSNTATALLASALTVGLATGISALLFQRTELADVMMVYLLGIVLVAMRFGYAPSLLATLLSVCALDLFFVPPYRTFTITESRHILTFGVMFFVALVISGLTARVRKQADDAGERELRISRLYGLSRDLANVASLEALPGVVSRQLRDVFECDAALLLPSEDGNLAATVGGSFVPSARELSAANAGFREQLAGRRAGSRTGNDGTIYMPLVAARGPVGVLGARPSEARRFREPAQEQLLETFAHQIALGIDRSALLAEAQQAQIQVQTEQLRNSLLSSVSHDLRTPLAVIKGAASALAERETSLSLSERQEFAESIVDEADRLNRLVGNLLDMTRLEAGVLQVRTEWQSVEEVVGTALSRLDDRLRARPIITDVPSNLPLAAFDAVLIEQVFINLLENAARYTPETSPIEIRASHTDNQILIEIADRGPGIPEGQTEKIFEKFQRAEAGKGGIGLGLTICRGIVTAHGGRIWAENRNECGASFRFTLPLPAGPPDVDRSGMLPETSNERDSTS